MPLPGALSNPDANRDLKKLAEVLGEAAARPEPEVEPHALRKRQQTPPRRRPGRVASLVLQALEVATEPMTTAALAQEIASRFGQQVPYESVRYVLRYGKAAQRGLIERIGNGQYAMRRAA